MLSEVFKDPKFRKKHKIMSEVFSLEVFSDVRCEDPVEVCAKHPSSTTQTHFSEGRTHVA